MLKWGVDCEEDCNQQWSDAVWGGVLSSVGYELLRQTKVELTQRSVSGVVGPHGCKDLADGSEVLFHSLLFDVAASCSKDARADAVSKEL